MSDELDWSGAADAPRRNDDDDNHGKTSGDDLIPSSGVRPQHRAVDPRLPRAATCRKPRTRAGQHFLYANLANAQSKQDVLDLIAQQFTFPPHFGKNFDALYDCMTDPLHKSGPQPGFVVVLEQIPANGKFDKEAREQLLDIFRDASDYWGDRKIPFRCFYSFL